MNTHVYESMSFCRLRMILHFAMKPYLTFRTLLISNASGRDQTKKTRLKQLVNCNSVSLKLKQN